MYVRVFFWCAGCACICVSTEARARHQVSFPIAPHLPFRDRVSLNQEIACAASLVGQQAPGSSSLCLPSAGMIGTGGRTPEHPISGPRVYKVNMYFTNLAASLASLAACPDARAPRHFSPNCSPFESCLNMAARLRGRLGRLHQTP